MKIEKHIPLASMTSFQIGGPARFFVRVKNVEELKKSLDFARDKKLTTFIFGGGSNVLFDDAGFEGLVIKIEVVGVEERGNLFIAGAGENWDALVVRAIEKNLWGIENLSGIPGCVGGAVVQNIGAYGQALSQALLWVEVYDTKTGEQKRLSVFECELGYRDSVFKHETGRYVILRAAFKLSSQGKPTTSYKDLAARFANKTPMLREVREAILDIRANKFPDLSVEGSAGSFFKNPILSETEARTLQKDYPELPLFPMPETTGVKVPLAWLFDHALKLKGLRVGSARLFERQPLVIAVEKNATARDVRTLAEKVKNSVRESLHIEIEPEVTVV